MYMDIRDPEGAPRALFKGKFHVISYKLLISDKNCIKAT